VRSFHYFEKKIQKECFFSGTERQGGGWKNEGSRINSKIPGV
jgi:hypothetical protein